MLYKMRSKINRLKFNLSCKDILKTKPLEIRKNNLKIVSLVSHLDLIMYLVAIKTFYKQLAQGEIIILNDGTLTLKDLEILNNHLSHPNIVHIRDIPNPLPPNLCWERLLLIAEIVKENFVIQLDSDTLTLGEVPEIVSLINENRSFVLGTSLMGQQIYSMKTVCEKMKTINMKHAQIITEQNFEKMPNYLNLKYVRGSGGLVGFSKNSFDREMVIEFSAQMRKNIGEIWFTWGCDQIACSYIVANISMSAVLPYPKYACFMPDTPYLKSAFLHFIGTYRFKNGRYSRLSKESVKNLNEAK